MKFEGIKFISYSYVSILKNPWSEIPINQEFALDLFGDSKFTQAGLNSDGFTITFSKFLPTEKVVLGPERIEIKRNQKENVLLLSEIISDNFREKDLSVRAYGINLSTEFILPEIENQTKWIADNLFSSNLQHDNVSIEAQNIRLKWTDDKAVINLSIEPRVDNKNALFVASNEHHEDNQPELFNRKQLEDVFSKAEETIESVLAKILGGIKD